MKIVTFNIRTLWDRDGINSFIHRIGLIYDKINEEMPDVIAFQEVTEKHIDVLRKLFPEYSFVGSGRLEKRDGEGLYTAFLKSCFTLLSDRVFWLSDSPELPGSRFNSQSIYPRICVYTSLKYIKTGETFGIYNVHLDYIGMFGHTAPPSKDEIPPDFDFNNVVNPRMLGIQRVLLEMQKNAQEEEPIILGDFNALEDDECLTLLDRAGYFDLTKNVGTTFHAFGKPEKYIKIDYIFAKSSLLSRVASAYKWSDSKNGIYLSDHYPVVVEIE